MSDVKGVYKRLGKDYIKIKDLSDIISRVMLEESTNDYLNMLD